MARDPGSVWAPLPEAGAPDGYPKNKFIVHSTGTRASAAANRKYFSQAAVVVESTFIVGLSPDDPTLQIMDSTDGADANGDANRPGISVEVVGLAGDPFTDHQVSELIRLGIWARSAHGIPAQVIPHATGAGFGWHVMFGAPGPWTSVRGKECPGKPRIRTLQAVIFPAIFDGHAPAAAAPAAPALTPAQIEENELMSAAGDIRNDIADLARKVTALTGEEQTTSARALQGRPGALIQDDVEGSATRGHIWYIGPNGTELLDSAAEAEAQNRAGLAAPLVYIQDAADLASVKRRNGISA